LGAGTQQQHSGGSKIHQVVLQQLLNM